MKIAILGWGSLIWQSKELSYDKTLGWQEDGVFLPVEFSRISSNGGRLTLVIDKNAEQKVKTLYAVSLYENLDLAILNLAIREGTDVSKIGFYNKQTNNICPENFEFSDNIREWILNKNFDAVIWTNLSVRFKDKIGLSLNADNVIKYLQTLPEEIKVLAEEYIRKAPEQVETAFRKKIEEQLGWKPIKPK
ncbi:MAG: hypothetical protein RBR78_09870 [Flavobacteriaceae bacterium]|jgi:hypothetical protein|nr:hypothetical protein [Flavobacteriaceae bacterium]